MEKIIREYKEFLESLKTIGLKEFIEQIKTFKESKGNYFKKIEDYLKQEIPQEILNLIDNEEFIKKFCVDSQAEYILNKFNLNKELFDILKTLVYCYNTNQREFKEELDLKNLEEELFKRGFKKISFLKWDLKEKEEDYKKRCEDYYKQFDKLKVKIVMDFNKMGILGSYNKKEEKEGKLIYSDYQKNLMFIPKRNRTRGFRIFGEFYIKEI